MLSSSTCEHIGCERKRNIGSNEHTHTSRTQHPTHSFYVIRKCYWLFPIALQPQRTYLNKEMAKIYCEHNKKYFSYLRKHLDHFMLIFFLIYEYYLYDNLFIFSAWICGRNRPTKYVRARLSIFYAVCRFVCLSFIHSVCVSVCGVCETHLWAHCAGIKVPLTTLFHRMRVCVLWYHLVETYAYSVPTSLLPTPTNEQLSKYTY